MAVAPLKLKVPGPFRLKPMGSLELARLALKTTGLSPTVTVEVVGLMLRVGTAFTVMVAEAVRAPAVAVRVAVPPAPLAGGV